MESNRDLVFFLVFQYWGEHPVHKRDLTDRYRDLSGPHFLIPFKEVQDYLTVSKKWRDLSYQLIPCRLTLTCYGFTPKNVEHLCDWWPALQHFKGLSKLTLTMQDTAITLPLYSSLMTTYGQRLRTLKLLDYRFTSEATEIAEIREKAKSLTAITFKNPHFEGDQPCTNHIIPMMKALPRLSVVKFLTSTNASYTIPDQLLERAKLFDVITQNETMTKFETNFNSDAEAVEVFDQVTKKRTNPLYIMARVANSTHRDHYSYSPSAMTIPLKDLITKLALYSVHLTVDYSNKRYR